MYLFSDNTKIKVMTRQALRCPTFIPNKHKVKSKVTERICNLRGKHYNKKKVTRKPKTTPPLLNY